MQDDDALSQIIGEIYDAALEPGQWPATLSKSAKYVGGRAAGLLSKDALSKVGTVQYHVGVDPHYVKLYEETYCHFDPLAPLYFMRTGEVISTLDYLAEDEFREGRFYREWAAPQGWIDSAVVVIEKSAAVFGVLSFLRGDEQGFVDEEMRRRVRLLIPHIRRAVLIGRTIELKSAPAENLADALDLLNASVFLVDEQDRMLHANATGHAMLATHGVLSISTGRLSATAPQAEPALRMALAAARGGDHTIGNKGIALPLGTEQAEHYVVHILPLTGGARRKARTRYGAATALFVQKAGLQAPSTAEVIATLYGLTAAELRVLLAMVDVDGVAKIAEVLGVTEHTVHTHLRRLFAKTGTRKQVELIKLVAGYSKSPVN